MDIKIYTSTTLGKQGPLTSTFGPSQDFPDSSLGKDSACKAVDISSIPGQGSFGSPQIDTLPFEPPGKPYPRTVDLFN